MTDISEENRIRVQIKGTDKFGTIPINEFDPKIYKSAQKLTKPDIESKAFEVPGLLGKLGRFFGPEKLGRRIGAGLSKVLPGGEQHKRVLERARVGEEKGTLTPGTTRALETGGVTNREALGSAALTGLNLALPFAGKALTPAKASLRSKAIRSALVGGLFGGAGGLEEGGTNKEIIQSAKTGALIGAIFPYAEKAIGTLIGKVKGVPRRMYNSIYRAEKDQLTKEMRSEARGVPFTTNSEWALYKERITGGEIGRASCRERV